MNILITFKYSVLVHVIKLFNKINLVFINQMVVFNILIMHVWLVVMNFLCKI